MTEELYMRRCFELAERAIGYTYPNPLVGAVIVHNGEIIGEGYHKFYGGPHAEVNAINSVKKQDLLKESTIYVNLEPCSHYGKTPPCADLIVSKQFKRVVISNKDPFPEVCGRGIKKLEDAGIEVVCGVLEEEGKWLNRRFFTFHNQKRPYTLLKWAQTADGYLDQERQDPTHPPLKISSQETLQLVYQLRGREAGIVVGTHTALLDNPSLSIRNSQGKQPTRILIDKDLKVPFSYQLYDSTSPTIVFTEKEAYPTIENVLFIKVPFDRENNLSIETFHNKLYELKIQSIVVEGGAQLLHSFLASGAWNEIRLETNENLYIRQGIKAPLPQGEVINIEQIGNNRITRFIHSEKKE